MSRLKMSPRSKSVLCPISLVSRSRERLNNPRTKKQLVEAVEWLRGNSPSLDGLDDPTLNVLKNVPSSEDRPLTPKQREAIVEQAASWVRKNNPKPSDVDDPTAYALGEFS
jgi:hypothetical protein